MEAYLQDGNCNISNNVAENGIRPFTVGRKIGCFETAQRGLASTTVYSLIETCKVNGLNCYNYLTYVMEELPNVPFRAQPELLEAYLPWSPTVQKNVNNTKSDNY